MIKTTPKSNNIVVQLINDILNLNTESYSYDAVGNRQTGPKTNDSYTYDSGNELLTSTGHLLLLDKNDQNAYDANGNLIRKTEPIQSNVKIITTYVYDDENRLIDVMAGNFRN